MPGLSLPIGYALEAVPAADLVTLSPLPRQRLVRQGQDAILPPRV